MERTQRTPGSRPRPPRREAWITVLAAALSAFLALLWVAAFVMVRRAVDDHLRAIAFQGVVALESALKIQRPPSLEHLREAVEEFEAEGIVGVTVVTRGGRVLASTDADRVDRAWSDALTEQALAAGEVRSGPAETATGQAVFRVVVPRPHRGPMPPGDGPPPGPDRPRGRWGGHPGPFAGVGLGELAAVVDVDPAPGLRMWHWVWAQGLASLAVILALAWGLGRARRAGAALEALEATARRREVLARLGEMSAVMAHEVRNPLAALKGHVQLAAESADDPADVRRRLDVVLGEVGRLEALVRGLLDYTADRPPRRGTVRLADVAARGAALGRAHPGLPACEVEVDADPEARADLDGEQAVRLVANLVENAVEAAGAGGRVRVRARRDGGDVVIAVEDSGPGLPADLAERVFDPFVTGKAKGIGLGLALVRKVAEAHGGRVSAGRSADLGGAAFEARLAAGSGDGAG